VSTAERLDTTLRNSALAVARVASQQPGDLDALVDCYARLGRSVSEAKACLIAALDVLDPTTPEPATRAAYRAVEARAFDLLRQAGAVFALLEPPFGRLVHGGGGWPSLPVAIEGRTLYQNSYKKSRTLSEDERRAEYAERVQKFRSGGGSFDDVIVLAPGGLNDLTAWAHYDYVMLPNLETRVYPTAEADRGGKPKAGHSLLIGSGPDFSDPLILSAGELWTLKDAAGDLEAVVIANNSGHYKPAFKDLPNTIPGLTRLGIAKERIVLFGGPNNIPAIFREMGEKHGLAGLAARLPPDPRELLDEWLKEGRK
jgi:hypothetical protein